MNIPNKSGQTKVLGLPYGQKHPNDPDIYTMTRHPNGDITIEANAHGGAHDAPFTFHYDAPKSEINEATGKEIRHPGQFAVEEQRPVSRGWNADDAHWEIDSEYLDLNNAISDIEKVESLATGKPVDPAKIKQRSIARKNAHDNPYDDLSNRYPEPDFSDSWWEYEN
jgi:hypothetical protein